MNILLIQAESAMYGHREAHLISYLRWWIVTNINKPHHFKDGRNWMYNSIKQIAKDLSAFGFTEKKVRNTIDALAERHVVRKDPHGFNNCTWYAFWDEKFLAVDKRYKNVRGRVQNSGVPEFQFPVSTPEPIQKGEPICPSLGEPVCPLKGEPNTVYNAVNNQERENAPADFLKKIKEEEERLRPADVDKPEVEEAIVALKKEIINVVWRNPEVVKNPNHPLRIPTPELKKFHRHYTSLDDRGRPIYLKIRSEKGWDTALKLESWWKRMKKADQKAAWEEHHRLKQAGNF